MSLIAWIVLGLVAGFIASNLVNRRGAGVFVDVLIGIVGSVVGGWLFSLAGMRGVTGFDVRSLVVAVVGSVVCLGVFHAIARRK